MKKLSLDAMKKQTKKLNSEELESFNGGQTADDCPNYCQACGGHDENFYEHIFSYNHIYNTALWYKDML